MSLEPSQPVVRLDHVTFGYGREVVLEDVSLEVGGRDFLAVIGPNGGGKSTLLKVMLGLVRPWSGEVRLRAAPGRIGYVPQFASFERQFPVVVRDVVRMGRIGRRGLLRRYTDEDERVVERTLELLDLGMLGAEPVAGLSGGQMQRTLIARALASEPEILLLDEPFASLDADSRSRLVAELRRLAEEVPVVTVTHDLTLFAGLVQHIACLNRRLHYHEGGELEPHMLEEVYGCPVELIAHGVPHRVLASHPEGGGQGAGEGSAGERWGGD